MNDTPRFYPVSLLAIAGGVSRTTLVDRARAGAWPERRDGNRIEFCPPPEIRQALPTSAEAAADAPPAITFTEITDELTRQRILFRETAVLFFRDLKDGSDQSRFEKTVAHFAGRHRSNKLKLELQRDPTKPFSARQLRRWVERYDRAGLNGLVDQKQGRVGVKPLVIPEEIKARLKAGVIELGSVARAVRREICNPELPAELRLKMHGAHASKSYVTPSVRKASIPSALTAARARGPRAARLAGRFTLGDYSKVKAGDVFSSDDMTSNIIAWTEWPNARGWKLGQPQILPVVDVGSLFWLNVRLIMRDGGQYNALDDIWGVFGDTFDATGLPRDGFVLEGGTWQSKAVTGHRTGLTNESRIGGLSSLGLRVIRSYDPRSKIIETMFNQLQYGMDAFPGWSGRDQRKQQPETIKKQLALCKFNHSHPREFFPHVSQLADHLKIVMENLNNERNDGMILRGRAPAEKWLEESAGLPKIPDAARWLYRSAMSVVQVTKNGVRITHGSGAKLLVYYYDNPELLVPRQGMKVIAFWNDMNPDADAILLDFRTRKFIGVAKRVQPLDRFAATDEQLAGERERKAAALQYARAELRSIAPELRRANRLVPVDSAAQEIGRHIAEAADAATAIEADRATVKRAVARTEVTAGDMEAATGFDGGAQGTARPTTTDEFSADEIARLFADEFPPGDVSFDSDACASGNQEES